MPTPQEPGDPEFPPPYDQDLSRVLEHLNPEDPSDQASLANDPKTKSSLRAGVELVSQHLGPGDGCRCGKRTKHEPCRLLEFLKWPTIAAATADFSEPFVRDENGYATRYRWKSQSDFVADLINFLFWMENYRPDRRKTRAEAKQTLVSGPDLADSIDEIARRHVTEGAQLPSIRLSLALMASGEKDPDVKRAIVRAYSKYLRSWSVLYKNIMKDRGLKFRPGVTPEDLAAALSAANDGVTLRAIVDPRSVVRDGRTSSLMGLITLAVINSLLVPIDDTSEETLEEVVANRL